MRASMPYHGWDHRGLWRQTQSCAAHLQNKFLDSRNLFCDPARTRDTVPNVGERKIRKCTSNSGIKHITLQVTDVHKPMCAMSMACKDEYQINHLRM